MLIQILMAFYLIMLLLVSWYLWQHRNRRFLVFDAHTNAKLSFLLQVTAMLLLAIALIGIYILMTQKRDVNLLTLGASALVILLFGLSFSLINRDH
mgnify:CR=1 FL=1